MEPLLIILDSGLQTRFCECNAFERIMALEGEVFRAQSGRRTLRFSHGNKTYFAKLHSGVGWSEIFKNLLTLRLPVLGARNEWCAIQRLGALGIATMRLAAYGARGWNPAQLESFVITEELADTISLEDFCRNWATFAPPVAQKIWLIQQIASIARRLHTQGVNHRDFYLCHFLLDTQSLQHLSLIDLHRVQLRKKTPERWIIKDIGGLYFSALDIGLSHRDLFRFMKIYAAKPLRTILTTDTFFWDKVTDNAQRLSRKPKRD